MRIRVPPRATAAAIQARRAQTHTNTLSRKRQKTSFPFAPKNPNQTNSAILLSIVKIHTLRNLCLHPIRFVTRSRAIRALSLSKLAATQSPTLHSLATEVLEKTNEKKLILCLTLVGMINHAAAVENAEWVWVGMVKQCTSAARERTQEAGKVSR